MSYGNWISNVINNGKKKVQEAVNRAVQTGQNVVNNVVNTAQNAVGNAVNTAGQVVQNVSSGYGNWVSQGQNAVNGAVQTGQQVVQNVASGYGDWVSQGQEVVNGAVQTGQQAATDYYNNTVVPTVNQAVETGKQAATGYYNNTVVPTVNNAIGQAAQNVTDTVNNVNGQIQQATGNAPTEQTPVQQATGNAPTEQTPVQQTPSQSAPATGGDDHIYSFEEFEQATSGGAASTDATNTETLNELNDKMELGNLTPTDLYNATEQTLKDVKQDIYDSAERQRQEAEREADIARQRAIADANSAYEQNKTGYGAKAEALGNMGLTGGGYSDWLEASAYAQNRAETQAARAQSDATKREAKYTEEQTKLAADTSYEQGMLENLKYFAENQEKSESNKLDYYEMLMKGAGNGTYNAEFLSTIADALGFSQEWKDALLNTETNYKNNLGKEESKLETEQNIRNFGGFMDNVRNGAYNGLTDEELYSLANEMGITLTDSQKMLVQASKRLANGEIDAADNEYRLSIYSELLIGAKDGTYTADELRDYATRYGLDEGMTNRLITAADTYETNKGNTEANAASEQKRADFINILSDIKLGAFKSSEIDAIAKQFGFDPNDPADAEMIQMFRDAAKAYEDGVDEMDENTKISIYSELLSGAKSGAYTEAEIADFANRFGLDDTMTSNLTTAVKDYNTKVSKAEEEQNAENKTTNFVNMLNDVKNGAYTKDEIAEIAAQLGFDVNDPNDKKLIDMLTAAADRYEAGIAEMDAATKTTNFVDLLGMVNSGQLTKEEAAEIAKQLGFDETNDKTSLDLLAKAADRYASGTEEDKKAAKTTNFIALLDGANTGAYGADEIAEIAAQLGFDVNDPNDKKLIDMLTKAATSFADKEAAAKLQSDTDYMNGVYAELMTAANNGDLDETMVRDLAERFGFGKQDQTKLGMIAKGAQDRISAEKTESESQETTSNKYSIMGDVTAYTSDKDIDRYVKDGFISETDAEEIKEYRNDLAYSGVMDMIDYGDIASGVSEADKFYKDKVITPDQYQTIYFEAKKSEVTVGMGQNDLELYLADIDNLESSEKINSVDAEALKQYARDNAGYKISDLPNAAFMSGKNTSIDLNKDPGFILDSWKADSSTSKLLDSLFGNNPSGGNSVLIDNQVYVRVGSTWINMPFDDETKLKFVTEAAKQPPAKDIEHTVTSSQNNQNQSSNSTSGVSGGGTPTKIKGA